MRGTVLLLAALSPAILSYGLLHSYLGVSIGNFVPDYGNDQVSYWNQISNFSAGALNAGYTVIDEKVATLSFLHTGFHGPIFPALYGSASDLFGHTFSLPIYLNCVLLGSGILAFALLAQLDWKAAMTLAFLIAISWAVLLYVPTSFQESFQQTLGLILAGLLVRTIRSPDPSRRLSATLLVAVAVAGLLRPSWLLLLFPAALLIRPPRSYRQALITLAAASAGLLLVYGAFALISAPSYYKLFVGPGPVNIVRHAIERIFTDPLDMIFPNMPGSSTPDMVLAAITWPMIAGCALALSRLRNRRPIEVLDSADPRIRELTFHVLNLGGSLIAYLAVYPPGNYLRILAPTLLCSVAIATAFHRWRPLAVYAVVSLVALPGFLDYYREWDENFRFSKTEVHRIQSDLGKHIKFQSGAPNGWCNTILVPGDIFDWRVSMLPPGIGATGIIEYRKLTWPIKSEYFIDDPLVPRNRIRFVRFDRMDRLDRTEAGTLYRNRDSACPEHGV